MVNKVKRSVRVREPFVFGDGEVVVQIAQSEVSRIALEIALLLADFSSELVLRSSTEQRIEISLGPDGHRSKVLEASGSRMRTTVPGSQMRFLQAVLLRAYRDEQAEVDHIHLEGDLEKRSFDLTVLFEVYAPPMSEEEAIKLLDAPVAPERSS